MECPLAKPEPGDQQSKNRDLPPNSHAAYCVQIHDQVVTLWRLSLKPQTVVDFFKQIGVIGTYLSQLSMMIPAAEPGITPDQVNKHNLPQTAVPGRALDFWIAENVLGWRRRMSGVGWNTPDGRFAIEEQIPRFSANRTAALQVYSAFPYRELIEIETTDCCQVKLGQMPNACVMGGGKYNDMPLLICRTAVRAMVIGQ